MRFLAASGVLDPHGPVAESMEDLWWFMLWLGVAVFVLFLVALGWGLLRSAVGEDEEAGRKLLNRWIGGGGVVLPTVVIAVVFGVTLIVMRDAPHEAPPDALEIEVTGYQFWYEVRYPDTGLVTANELHIPVGRPVAFRLASTDVIHSFWVPELGGKLDMLPERVNTLVLQADEPGVFTARCAEFCGLSHAFMEMIVVAEPAGDFDAWMDEQLAFGEPEGDLPNRGLEVFRSANCVSCHAPRGAGTMGDGAPDLTTLPARRTVGAGLLPNTPENVARFIQNTEELKPGVVMPATELSEDDMEALLAYLGYEVGSAAAGSGDG